MELHQWERSILFRNSLLIIEIFDGYTDLMEEDSQTIKHLGLFVVGIGGLIFIIGIVAYLFYS